VSAGLGLAASERVRRRPDFERAYESGIRIQARFMTLFVVANGGTVSRLGVAATRKLGASVERNRAKRLAREVFRRHKIRTGVDIVIVPRRGMLDASFASLEIDYRDALERRHKGKAGAGANRHGGRHRRSGATSSL
jgi:ribonuclease P protein component